MSGKNMVGIFLMLIWFGVIGFDESLAQPPKSGQAYAVDPDFCALMLRKGKESFARGRYNEAKELFRKAVQADPNSKNAWSYYDLSQMYSVAEQFKNHGRIVVSTAPALEETAGMPQPQPIQSGPITPVSPAVPKPPKREAESRPH